MFSAVKNEDTKITISLVLFLSFILMIRVFLWTNCLGHMHAYTRGPCRGGEFNTRSWRANSKFVPITQYPWCVITFSLMNINLRKDEKWIPSIAVTI